MNIDPWNIFTSNFGAIPKPYTALATLGDMLMYFVVLANVARARGKYKVEAPVTDGPDEFKRAFRVQMNTLEQLALHLPLLWIAAFAMSDVFAAAFGTVWIFGRALYARGYYVQANRRAKGFIISMGVNLILFIGAVVGTFAALSN